MFETGTATAAIDYIELLGERVRLVNKQLRACKAKLDSSLEELVNESPEGQRNEQRDVTIIQTMPRIGECQKNGVSGTARGGWKSRFYSAGMRPWKNTANCPSTALQFQSDRSHFFSSLRRAR